MLSLAFAAPCCGLAPGALVAQNARLQGIQCGLAPSRFADEVVLPLLPEGGKNWQVTNRFGNVVTSRDVVGLPPGQWQHTGVDYVLGGSTEASGDQTVHAIAAGTVVFSTASAANPVPRRGGLVVVHHVAAGDREFQVPAWTNPSGASGYPPSTTRNFYSYYLHLSPEGLAAQGKVVEAGEGIGHTYSRAEQLRLGLAYPPHLHLEVWTQCVEADRNGYDTPGPEFTSGLGNPEVNAAAFLMENAWATLPNGTEDKERQVTFRADGTVLTGVVPLTRVREPVDVSGASVLVSPPAVLRGYQVILVVDPDVGAREAYLLGEGLRNPRNLLPQGWAVQRWLSWSPEAHYGLLLAGGEVTNGDMLVLSVRSQTAREVHFRSFVDANREVQVVDPASIHWVGPGTFRGLLTVHCNGFEVRGCEGPAEERVLRRVSFVVTVSTPQVQIRYP